MYQRPCLDLLFPSFSNRSKWLVCIREEPVAYTHMLLRVRTLEVETADRPQPLRSVEPQTDCMSQSDGDFQQTAIGSMLLNATSPIPLSLRGPEEIQEAKDHLGAHLGAIP